MIIMAGHGGTQVDMVLGKGLLRFLYLDPQAADLDVLMSVLICIHNCTAWFSLACWLSCHFVHCYLVTIISCI